MTRREYHVQIKKLKRERDFCIGEVMSLDENTQHNFLFSYDTNSRQAEYDEVEAEICKLQTAWRAIT